MALVMSVPFRQKPSLDGEAEPYPRVWWLGSNMHMAGVHQARTLR